MLGELLRWQTRQSPVAATLMGLAVQHGHRLASAATRIRSAINTTPTRPSVSPSRS